MLLLLLTSSLVGNAMHVHFSDCEHFHEFGRIDEKSDTDGDLPTSLGQDEASGLLFADCQWSDFTVVEGVKPAFAAVFLPLNHYLPYQRVLYRAPSLAKVYSSESLRGPPSL